MTVSNLLYRPGPAGTPGTHVLHPPLEREARRVAAEALHEGRVMTYPTETSYALGGNALNAELVQAVYRLKGRPWNKPLLLLVDGSRPLGPLVGELSEPARTLMAACWPGPLTLVVPAGPALPAHLRIPDGTVAVRWSPNPVVAELLAIGGVPLIGTSANLTGAVSALTAIAVERMFPGRIELVVDGGRAPGGLPSSLVDTTRTPPVLLREGALPKAELERCLGATVVLPEPAS